MSDTLDVSFPYRGDLKAAVGVGSRVAFVAIHPEGQPTGLNWLDLTDDRPRWLVYGHPGGAALASGGDGLWIAGRDGRLHHAPSGEDSKPIGPAFQAMPRAVALLAGDRLAVLAGTEVTILSRKRAAVVQTLALPEPGTVLAVDPSGRWLAAGTEGGTVAIFEAETSAEFQPGDASRLHEGEVTALLFERDDLRFFSAGADLKLLSTHARGRLEPEDKGRGNVHTDRVTAMIWGPEDRFFTGSRDGTVKSWPRVGGVKPVTQKDGVVKVVSLTLAKRHGRDHLVIAGEDNTLRVFSLDAAGKFGSLVLRVHDALASARDDLSGDDPRIREAAIRQLAKFDDAAALAMLSERVGRDADHGLRLLAAQLLGASDHPRAPTLLEGFLTHNEPAVRAAAFEGLRRQRGPSDLRTLDLSLRAERAEIGRMAVEALQAIAAKDDQALARLTSALSARTPEIRQAAITALEAAYPAKSPTANLVALGAEHADVRRSALLRLHRRGLLGDPGVQAALRRRVEDPDPDVRRVAFLLALQTRKPLLDALRARDPEVQRQLAELEGTDKAGAVAPPKAARGPDPAARVEGLSADDLAPLLQAAASRSLDTSLRGARGLAVLGDPRAFGLLLQLTREEAPGARVEVCRALAALDDPRASERLRSLLSDPDLAVRDAAFTALARLDQDQPLRAAEVGLHAPAENVRQRALQLLVAEARKSPALGPESPARAMLADALNDSLPAVRGEAFKASLNLKVGGGGPATLRFAMRSLHADVRREALTEAMAGLADPGGWDVLMEFFNDPDPALRASAFEFAAKKSKGLEILDAALGSRYADLRKVAVDGLVKKHTAASQKLLIRALEDEDRGVRLAALTSLVEDDARPVLSQAIDSPHPDVRLCAAKALARHGDPAAVPPLLALTTAPEPREDERKKDWADLAESALDGLGELGDPSSLTVLIPLIDSPHPAIRQRAAQAMAWCAPPDKLAPLLDALRHDDPRVKYHAALGLAYAGDASAGTLVFSEAATGYLNAGETLGAALALADSAAGEGHLVAALDDKNAKARSRALLLLLMLEWKRPRGSASRCLAALSSRDGRTRLLAAEALEALADPSAFAGFLVRLVNDRDGKPWTIPLATVDTLAELLVRADPRLRARTARLLRHLDADEQDAWNQAWAIHSARFASEIASLRTTDAGPVTPPRPQEKAGGWRGVAAGAMASLREATGRGAPRSPDAAQALRELAFGAYVGLLREQGGSQKGVTDAAVLRVRQTALNRLLSLAKADPAAADAARQVLVQALGDPNAAIRIPAFEALPSLDLDAATLAAEALGTGHLDLGVKALETLAAGGTTNEGRRVLDQAMLTRRDDLAAEAARLLIAREGAAPVAGRALEAAHEPLRLLAVSWLVDQYEKDPSARDLLRGALKSRHAAIREAAALRLATKKDPEAFDALVTFLGAAPRPDTAWAFLNALVRLGDPRAASAFLDRVENDPAGTAPTEELILAAGQFRRPEVVDRLFALWDRDRKHGSKILLALHAISGHDQEIEDPEDERPDRSGEQAQFPRRDDVLARLLARVTAPGEKGGLVLIPSARWARSKAVDPVLAGLVRHPDEMIRRAAIEALGWRLRKRDGDPAPLMEALGSKDPVAQLLAAEGLARAGLAEGISVLLASVEFVPDLDLRRRAVRALGELADPRAVDVLMKLASEEGHALQDAASEAIGHLGASKHAEAIGRLLERHARGQGSVVAEAYKGLRWLGTPSAWRLIRERAADRSAPYRDVAIEQLAHHDDPATRDLLLRMLAEEDSYDTLEVAFASARRLFGPEALEPDEAILQNEEAEFSDDQDHALLRVSERGTPARIFAILARCPSETVRDTLARSLMTRPTLPVAEAQEAVASREAVVAGLAAHILGWAGGSAKGAPPVVEAALGRWWAAWDGHLKEGRREQDDDDEPDRSLVSCLRHLAWAAGRLGVGIEILARMATADAGGGPAAEVREAAVEAIASLPATPAAMKALEAAAEGGDPGVRALAAQALGRDAPDRAAGLAERLISDRVAFDRLSRAEGERLTPFLRQVARQVHYQGVAVPHLVKNRDVGALAAVAEDRSLAEAARLGAVEGLAAMAIDAADEVLRRIGRDEREDEDFRKAAWRGLRRSQRAGAKARPPKAEVRP